MSKTEQEGEAYLAIHALIDRSGSMGGYADFDDAQMKQLRDSAKMGDEYSARHLRTAGQVREAINSLIGALQAAFMPPHLAVTMFSTGTPQTLIEGRPINEVPLLTPKQYSVTGGTATSSAILHAIEKLDAVKAGQKVLLILTDGDDGEEGSGKHALAKAAIQKRIADGWAVIVMATTINPKAFADSHGIPHETSIMFTNNIPAAMRAVAHLCLRAGNGKPAFTAEERAAAKVKA